MTLDQRVLREMKRMRVQGYQRARVGTVQRRIARGWADSVAVLGAMLRVEPAYRRWVNQRER